MHYNFRVISCNFRVIKKGIMLLSCLWLCSAVAIFAEHLNKQCNTKECIAAMNLRDVVLCDRRLWDCDLLLLSTKVLHRFAYHSPVGLQRVLELVGLPSILDVLHVSSGNAQHSILLILSVMFAGKLPEELFSQHLKVCSSACKAWLCGEIDR